MQTTHQSACAFILCLLLSGCSTFFPVFEQPSATDDGPGPVREDGDTHDLASGSSPSDLGEADCPMKVADGKVKTCWDFSSNVYTSANLGWKQLGKWSLKKPGYLSIDECPQNVHCTTDSTSVVATMPTFYAGSAIASVLVRVTHDVAWRPTSGYKSKISLKSTGMMDKDLFLAEFSTGTSEFKVDMMQQTDMRQKTLTLDFTLIQSTDVSADENTTILWKIKRVELIPICAAKQSSCPFDRSE